ncbi:hypothetical protein GGF32_004498 [Allomyces javanicus]|nr:hypothetical protein GGF32_004498 [Allomyces javanicus]
MPRLDLPLTTPGGRAIRRGCPSAVLYSKGPNHGHAPFAVRIVPVETADQVGQLPTQQDDATTAAATAHHGVAWLHWSGTLALWQMMWFWLWLVHLGTTRAWTVLVSNEPRALPAPSEEKDPGPRYDWQVVVDPRQTPVQVIEVGRWSPDRNRE